jgi:hypothetical protein
VWSRWEWILIRLCAPIGRDFWLARGVGVGWCQEREREREREEEAAWRSSQISTMLPLTSQLSGKNLELQLLVSMMLTGSHLCLENTPVWNLKKKLIEWDREFGFLICWGVFFFGVQGASTERSGSYSWFRKCLFWSLWFSFLVRFGLLGFWRSKQWWSVCCVGNLFVSDIDLVWRMRGSYRGWDLGQVAMTPALAVCKSVRRGNGFLSDPALGLGFSCLWMVSGRLLQLWFKSIFMFLVIYHSSALYHSSAHDV